MLLTQVLQTTGFSVDLVTPSSIPEFWRSPITQLASRSFGTEMSEEEVWSHMVNVDLTVLLWRGSELKGFLSANIYSQILFIHGVVIDHNLKGYGLSKMLLSKVLKEHLTCYIALTTQNPRVFGLLSSVSNTVYPSPGKVIPVGLMESLREVVHTNFSESGVLTDYYPQCLYSSIPTAKNHEVDSWFLNQLGAQSRVTRNAFIFVGRR